ncbi:MAG: ABC transporter permease [Nanoarchaeota archaeon]|nr:ABC transporter permease [Nanoarchaeota archaeon]
MNFLKLLKLIEKNFKLIWTSKFFVLSILLGPLLLTLLLGFAFNNSKDYTIRVGVFSENYDGVKASILDNLNDNFMVIEFSSLGECVDAVKGYSTHICVVMPVEITLEGDELSEVVFYADNSRVNLVWLVLDSLSNIFSLSSQQLSAGMTSDLLGRLSIAERKSLELQEYMDEVLEQEDNAVLLSKEMARNMAVLNLVKARGSVDKSLVLEGKIKQSFESDFQNIESAVAEGRSALSQMESVLGVNSSVSAQISQLNVKLGEIEELAKDNDGVSSLSELDSMLVEVRDDFNELEKNFEIVVRKNGELLVLLGGLRDNLEAVDGLVDGLYIAVSNLKVTRADKIVEPIRTKIEPVSVEKTYLGYIFPSLVLLMVVFVSVLLSSSLIIMEKKNRSFFRNWLSRGWGLGFILSYFVTNLMIVLVDIFVFVLIARFVFDIFINMAFVGLLVLIAGVFVLLGLVIGFLTKNEQSNVLLGVGVSSVLVFFSNTLIPIESAAGFLRNVVGYNPFVIGESLLRKALQGVGFGSLQHDLLMMVICFLVLVVVLIILSVVVYEKKFDFESLFRKRVWKKWKK